MNIIINNDTGTWCYDICGNVFVNIADKFYVLEVNGRNDLEFSLIENDIFLELSDKIKIKYNKIVDLDTDTLKKRILDEIDKSDSDQDDDTKNYKNKMRYLKEDRHYVLEKDDSDRDEEIDDVNYRFYQKGDGERMVFLNKGLETMSIYDTYVRDKEKNVVLSLQSDCDNSYRVSVYEDGGMELNIVGDEIRRYDAREILKKCHSG